MQQHFVFLFPWCWNQPWQLFNMILLPQHVWPHQVYSNLWTHGSYFKQGEWVKGKNKCDWSSCREGCTKEIFTCWKIKVNYLRNDSSDSDQIRGQHVEGNLFPNVYGCGYPPRSVREKRNPNSSKLIIQGCLWWVCSYIWHHRVQVSLFLFQAPSRYCHYLSWHPGSVWQPFLWSHHPMLNIHHLYLLSHICLLLHLSKRVKGKVFDVLWIF